MRRFIKCEHTFFFSFFVVVVNFIVSKGLESIGVKYSWTIVSLFFLPNSLIYLNLSSHHIRVSNLVVDSHARVLKNKNLLGH